MANSVLQGTVTHPDGEWLVGNALPQGHPGWIEPNDPRGLYFKMWVAGVSPKYARTEDRKGWEPSLPAHGGRTEFVQVLEGRFACERKSGTAILEDGGAVTLAPDEYRCWFLPKGEPAARGVAICHWPNTRGFEYHRFRYDLRTAVGSCAPVGGEFRWKLVVVFSGALERPDETWLVNFQYEFWEAWADVKFVAASGTSFTVLYF